MTKTVEVVLATMIMAGLVMGAVSCRTAVSNPGTGRRYARELETRQQILARIERSHRHQRLFMNLSYLGFGMAGAGFLTGLALGLAEGNLGASKELVDVTVVEKYSYVAGELRPENTLSEGAVPYFTLRLPNGTTREYRASAEVFNGVREGAYGTAVLRRGRVVTFRGTS